MGDPPRPTPDRAARLAIEIRTSGSGVLCRQLLEELPDWFGIPEAIDEYVVKADRLTAVVAIAETRRSVLGGSRARRGEIRAPISKQGTETRSIWHA